MSEPVPDQEDATRATTQLQLPPPSVRLPPRGERPRPAPGRGRRVNLTLQRVDPWSVFLFSLVASAFLGLAFFVAVAILYAVLANLGVFTSLNTLIGDVTADPAHPAAPSNLITAGPVLTVTALVAAVDVILLTALATLGAFLYNVTASLTGGIRLTLGDDD